MTIQHDDGLPDDRVQCGECHLFDDRRKYCTRLRMLTWADLPVRCVAFMPAAGDPDQRTGRERWPDINKNIEDARAIDLARAKGVTA